MAELIRGAGGGGKGGGSSGGHESDDTLFSTAYIEVIEAVCEGQVAGLVNGGNSIYMNNTPVIAANGAQNHKVTWDTRTGWQAQDPFPAVQSVSAETSVSTLVTQATPVIATITNEEADAAVVTVGFPRMMSADDKGNIGGSSVEFKIECQPYGGSYAPVARKNTKTQAVAVSGVFQSPVGTYRSEIYVRSFTAAAVDILYSSDGASWTVAETVQLTQNQQWTIYGYWFEGYTALTLAEGVHYIKWQYVDHAGVTQTAGTPGFPMNTLTWYSYTVVNTLVITGKTMSKYQRQYRFELPGSAPWSIRVTRITSDSASAKLANELWFDNLRTEVVARLNYPNTALMYYRIAAAEFSSIPRRRAEWKLLIVRVPTNYDPVTRLYDGVWDGSFKNAWTDNPAWCFYDICTSGRYGVGNYLSAAEVDKWALYAIGKYCDELVDSGSRDNAGAIIYEPRFRLNILINETKEAFQWLRDLASVFRGMMYIINGILTTRCDQPADPVKLFAPANVINGQFKFSGTGALARKTVALVSWRDPADMYNTKVEYVPDEAAIRRYGINPTEVVAVGCTSRGQAHRVGKWVLLDGEVMAFGVGHDAAKVEPGNILACQIPLRSSGQRLGGRVQYVLGTMAILDAPVSLIAGRSYQLYVIIADGSINGRAVVFTESATTDTLTLASEFDGEVVDGAIWILADLDDIKFTLWRVLDIKEGEGFTATITAISHDQDKYAKIDTFDSAIDASLLPAINPLSIAAPETVTIENLSFTDLNNIAQNKLHVHWSQVPDAMRYQLRYRVNGGNWINATVMSGTLFELLIKDDGAYDFGVAAVSVLGASSPFTESSVTITGEATALNFDAQWSD